MANFKVGMQSFRPAIPYTTAIELLIPEYTTVKGVPTKVYPENGVRMNCSFKTYLGTETVTNDLFTVLDTATIETWYRPDFKSDCRIKVLETGRIYEILGSPEDIFMRHQFIKCKVQAVEGGA